MGALRAQLIEQPLASIMTAEDGAQGRGHPPPGPQRRLLIVDVTGKIVRRRERSITVGRFLALRQQVEGPGRSMNVNGFGAKLLDLIGPSRPDLPSAIQLSDIYAARNCLVHKGGLVDDASAPAGQLPASWRRMALVEFAAHRTRHVRTRAESSGDRRNRRQTHDQLWKLASLRFLGRCDLLKTPTVTPRPPVPVDSGRR